MFYTIKIKGDLINFSGGIEVETTFRRLPSFAKCVQQNKLVLDKPDIQLKITKKDTEKENLPRVSARQAIVYFTSRKTDILPELLSQIDKSNLTKHINYLASDELEGRYPGTEGIKKAEKYIIDSFKASGLKPFKPLTGDSYKHDVIYNRYFKNFLKQHDLIFKKDRTGKMLNIPYNAIPLSNLIGYIPAKQTSDEYVFITAHYDHLGKNRYSGKVYTGADDNASGVAALLEVAKVLGKTKPDKNIVFVATSAEEMGGIGASYLGKLMLEKGLKDKVQILNMDCLAAEGDYMTIEGGQPSYNKKLQSTAMNMANKINVKYDIESYPKNDRTDAAIFEKLGFPAITFLWAWEPDMANRPHYHKVTDRPEIANFDNVEKSTKLSLATTWLLSKN